MENVTKVKKKLSLRRRKFAKAFARTGNATQSAKEAGYSEKTAYSSGHRLTKSVEVLEVVEHWEEYLERQIRPSIKTLEELRDSSDADAIKLKSAETLLKMAGVGQQKAQPTNVNIFTSMSEEELLKKLGQSDTKELSDGSED